MRTRLRPYIFLVLSTILIVGGGCITLLLQVRQRDITRAASADLVVGSPTLPAATVDAIFARMGSPMYGNGKAVELAATQANIDDAFALAVWWTETNDGAAGVGLADLNPGSVRGTAGYPAAYDGYTIYLSYSAAIYDWFTLLRNNYVNQGLTSVYTISQPYVGTSSSGQWAAKVVNLMANYRSEAPPPTPVPTATPARSVVMVGNKLVNKQPMLKFNRSQGQMQEGIRVGGVMQAGKATSAVVAQVEVKSTQSTPGTLALLCIALLAAIGVACWGMIIGRRLSLKTTSIAANSWTGSITQGLELFSTQRLPVSSHVAMPLPDPALTSQEWQNFLPASAAFGSNGSTVSMSETDALLQSNIKMREGGNTVDGALVLPRGLSLHGRMPEPVEVESKPQGLLGRYKVEADPSRKAG